ncbi:MAG: winged helix-turn-helix transcriptional regulator [Clostridiales bacterium]|nr:winged helix-turn-helix transcriptional regulator [Clostridiales bacterium]
MKQEIRKLEKLFRIFDRVHQNILKAEFAKRGISEVSHPAILIALNNQPDGMMTSQKGLAEKLGISQPAVALSLLRMEKSGLVKKVMDSKDMRRNFVIITEKGKSLMEECTKAICSIDDEMFKEFSDEECIILEGFYIRMIQALEVLGGQVPTELKSVSEISIEEEEETLV